MGVDPKRPLVGFALVAVLCAVLMSLSVGRGWSADLFHAGRPIVTAATGGHLDRTPSPTAQPVEPTGASYPDALIPDPIGIAAGAPVAPKVGSRAGAVTTSGSTTVSDPESDAEVEPEVVTAAQDTSRVGKADRRGDRDAAKAERKADKAERKVERREDKDTTRRARSQEKAAGKAEKAADKAARQAEKDAEKAARQAEKAADKAVKDAEKAARKGES